MSLNEVCAVLQKKVDDKACPAIGNPRSVAYIANNPGLRGEANRNLRHAIKAFRRSPEYQHADILVEDQLDYLDRVVRKWGPKEEKDNLVDLKACLEFLKRFSLMSSNNR